MREGTVIGRNKKSLDNDMLENIIKNSNLSFFITDIETDELLYANNKLLHDFKVESYEGKKCWEVFQRNQIGRCEFCVLRNVPKEITQSPIVWQDRNTITNKWLRNMSSIITWFDGRLAHLNQTIDISDLMQASNQVATQLEQQRVVTKITKDMISLKETKSLIHEALETYAQLLQVDRILVGIFLEDKRHLDFKYSYISEEDPENAIQMLNEFEIETGIMEIFTNAKNKYMVSDNVINTAQKEFFEKIHTKAYITVPLLVGEILYGMISVETTDKPRQWTQSEVDLTVTISNILGGVLLRERMLEEAEKRSSAMLDAIPICTNFFNKEGDIIDCNEETLRLLQFDSKEDYLKNFKLAMPKYQPGGHVSREKLKQHLDATLKMKEQKFEFYNCTKSGTVIPLEVTMKRIDYGEETAIISAGRDLREAKAQMAKIIVTQNELKEAVKEAEESNRVKTDFLASMSHEIRTPMNVIIGMSELLAKDELIEQQRGYVNDIRTASVSLLNIINDILDISKIEAGKMQLVRVDYELYPFLDNIESMFTFEAKRKNLYFKKELVNELPRYVYGDNIRLRQVLVNLLGNAVKFTHKGGITFRIRERMRNLYIDISDTGIGIKEEDMINIFDRFEQLDLRKSRGVSGTGLGLPITKSIIEAMNGRIWVESTYGKGTIFHLRLPYVVGNEKNITAEKNTETSFIAPEAKILVIDDNEMNLNVAKGILNTFEINCDTAASGIEGIRKATEGNYDLIFMDHMMPGVDGIEATKILRKDSRGAEYKIVALTANAIHGVKEELIAAGMDDYLTKPINRVELKNILEKWLPKEVSITKRQEKGTKEEVILTDFSKAIKALGICDISGSLKRMDGNQSLYQESITSFIQKLPDIRAQLKDYIEKEDLNNFVINIHGLKSMLRSIGVDELGQTAEELEENGMKGDFLNWQCKYFNFDKQLDILYEQFKTVIKGKEKKQAENRIKSSKAALNVRLNELTTCINELEADACKVLLKEILEIDFGEKKNAKLQKLSDLIDNFEYVEALELIERIMD